MKQTSRSTVDHQNLKFMIGSNHDTNHENTSLFKMLDFGNSNTVEDNNSSMPQFYIASLF